MTIPATQALCDGGSGGCREPNAEGTGTSNGSVCDAGLVLEGAFALLEENARRATDGAWLEDLTRDVAPHIRDWNVDGCWRWEDWPDRDEVMPAGTSSRDVGIDLVARRSDGAWIAIQAKSRKLDEYGAKQANSTRSGAGPTTSPRS